MSEEKKGKAGKYCPIREPIDGKERACGNYCAWFCKGLQSCVLHGLNLNLQLLRDNSPENKGEPKEGPGK